MGEIMFLKEIYKLKKLTKVYTGPYFNVNHVMFTMFMTIILSDHFALPDNVNFLY